MHHIYRIFRLLLICGLLATPVCSAQAALGPEPLRIIYGFDREFPPFSFEEAGGKSVGFDVELMEAIVKGRGNLVLRPLQWEAAPLELSSGIIHVTTGMVPTEQRSRLYNFSDKPVFSLQIRLFTKTYNRFPSAQFLRGQMVSVEQGTYAHRMLENFGGINIKPYKGKIPPIRALYNDEVPAYCGPVQTTYYYLNKLNYGSITTLGTPLGITDMHIAINKNRGDIRKVINEGLAEVIANGEYERIYRKWFVSELSDQEKDSLIKAANAAVIAAYAPYSKRGYGAAVLTATGKIYAGCTVESAVSRLSVSAYTSAVAQAVAASDLEIRGVVCVDPQGVITAPTDDEVQFMHEFGRGILTVLEKKKGELSTHTLSELLPNAVVGKTATVNLD